MASSSDDAADRRLVTQHNVISGPASRAASFAGGGVPRLLLSPCPKHNVRTHGRTQMFGQALTDVLLELMS